MFETVQWPQWRKGASGGGLIRAVFNDLPSNIAHFQSLLNYHTSSFWNLYLHLNGSQFSLSYDVVTCAIGIMIGISHCLLEGHPNRLPPLW
jgi:hypothetical protein